jgi:hypothetical protein
MKKLYLLLVFFWASYARSQTITLSGLDPAITDLYLTNWPSLGTVAINPNLTYQTNPPSGMGLPLVRDAGTNYYVNYSLPSILTINGAFGPQIIVPGPTIGTPIGRYLDIVRKDNYWEIHLVSYGFTTASGLVFGHQPLYRCKFKSFDNYPPCNSVWEKASGYSRFFMGYYPEMPNYTTGIFIPIAITVASGALCNPATTCQFTGAGPWSSAFNWSCSDGTNHVPTTTDIAIVMPGSSITLISDVHVFDFHNYGTLYLGIPPGPYYSISAP